jgi:hypothetical protein
VLQYGFSKTCLGQVGNFRKITGAAISKKRNISHGVEKLTSTKVPSKALLSNKLYFGKYE